jgi:VWFA-related protein
MTNVSWTGRIARGLLPALVVSAIVAGGTVGFARQGAEPEIVFETPRDDSYVSGPSPIRVRLSPPDTAVRNVSLFADGRLVCAIEQAPFECPWEAGGKVVEHVLRATALLPDGRRIAKSIRTRGVEYTETVDVDVVQVTATVTSGRGKFVRGLTRDKFIVYEDGVRQTLTSFAAEEAPLEIVVAVDFSGSMKDAMPTVKEALKKFLRSLRPTDRVTLLGFNDSVFTLSPATADLAARLKAVDRLRPWGGTALYDVIVRAVGELGKQSGRRAMVVFTDGEDLHSKAPLASTERLLESSDALVYAIGQGRAPSVQELKKILERLAEKSGGRAFFEDLDGLDGVFRDIIADLSNQYLLGYVPKDASRDSRWRELKVEVPGTGYDVRARRGYRAVVK